MTWKSERSWTPTDELPSASQINKAGDRLRKAVAAGEEIPRSAWQLMNLFRRSHQATGEQLMRQLRETIRASLGGDLWGVGELALVGRPLKRTESIIAKLVREKTRLTTMQDIAGARIRVGKLERQNRVMEVAFRGLAEWDPPIAKDSREDADRNGYRALHVVVQVDGRRAELQIRTTYQDRWAQIIEDYDDVYGWDLKHRQAPAEWLEWAQMLSDEYRKADLGKPFTVPPNPDEQMIDDPDDPA